MSEVDFLFLGIVIASFIAIVYLLATRRLAHR